MAWSSDFKAALTSQSIAPTYRLMIWRPFANTIGQNLVIYSDRGDIRIGRSGPNISGTSVIPSRWSVSFGGFDLDLVGDLSAVRDELTKGALGLLQCAFIGLSGFETISIGQVKSISGFAGRYRVVFDDFVSALQSRLDTRYDTTLEYNKWFFSTVHFSTVTHNWSVGATSLQVNSTANYERQSASIDGVIYCIPQHGGDPFYMRWNAATSTTLTLTTGTASHPSTTTASDLKVGDRVYNAVRITSAPWSFFARLMTSTGTGSNGPFDELPANWTAGAPIPIAMFDYADAETTQSYIKPATGSFYQVDYVQNQPLQGGFRDILNQFNQVGMWVSMKENSFTWRGANDPTGQYHTPIPVSASITDEDIIGIDRVEMYDTTLSAPYMRITQVYDLNGNQQSYLNTVSRSLPTTGEIERTGALLYSSGGGNRASMAQGDIFRMRIWDQNHCTKIVLRLPLRFAGLCAGDAVQIKSSYLVDMSTDVGRTYNNRRGMVLAISYNISERMVSLTIGLPPLL